MTFSARSSGDIIRKASKATVVLQGFAVMLLVGLIFLFTDISRRYLSLQDGVRENALWSVYQLDREARRLHEALHVMLAEKDYSSVAVKALGTRYDILYSRINILEKTSFERKFKLDSSVERRISEIRSVVLGQVGFFDALNLHGTFEPEKWQPVDNDLEKLVSATESLLVYTNSNVSSERAEARQALLALQLKSGGLVILLVGCVVVLIFILRRQLKSVRLAGLSLEMISNELNDAYLDAEAGNRAKSQFMATMGHEVRTPLNAILATAELLELSTLSPSVASGMQTIRRSGQALLEVINEILDFAKIEHGKLDIEIRPVDLSSVLSTTIEMVRDRATEQGNQIALNVPQTFKTPALSTDPTRLRQVLLNLLSNAIKFTSNGTITLCVREIETPQNSILRFEISDNGIGIDADGLCRLFQPFSQVDASISRKYGGTGLGLTICKQIVEAMKGRIGVESAKGQGSTFWFEIPVVAAELPVASPAAVERGPSSTLPVLNVLLVEDNLVNQQVAAGFLNYLGQKVTVVSDGCEAVEAVAQQPFDLILMDMQMPRMDGIEATRLIRDAETCKPCTPIIAMTANASDDDRRLCAGAGMTGFQSKPVSLQQLRGIIEALGPSKMEASSTVGPAVGINNSFALRRAEIIEALGEETFDELLSSFFDDATTLLQGLHEAMAANDYRSADHLLHTIKGAASGVGLQEIADTSQRLRSGPVSKIGIAKLSETVDEFRQRLTA
ncbi:ATP-binding protein [Agrobacterium tumefaciens]|uniref:ATP-binding protein n=1 Tax=Agrobacterium tumefaciens TaxID=358 RepID=UPI0015730BF3|nr:ATP-binding protein [Agrobacterium tumefaciens]NTA19456.1 response regulator [Agrobacterium tumefaciens]WCK74470.1 ATP-binding protein [Agrobacterium tumefaciens]